MSSRRNFLKGALGFGGAAAAAGLANGCVRWIDPAPVVNVPAPVNGKLSLELARYPDLAPLGSALKVRPAGADSVLVVHWPGDTYGAFASECTHAGCPLGYADGAIECPCHGARFDESGNVINPPAPQALKRYDATLDRTAGMLVIDMLGGTAGFPTVQSGQIFFPFAQFPQLRSAGGFVAGVPGGLGRPLIVIALQGGGYSALDATCPHLQCTSTYTAGDTLIRCPCHGSTFTLTGVVQKPPATSNLKTFAVTSDATGVTVTVA